MLNLWGWSKSVYCHQIDKDPQGVLRNTSTSHVNPIVGIDILRNSSQGHANPLDNLWEIGCRNDFFVYIFEEWQKAPLPSSELPPYTKILVPVEAIQCFVLGEGLNPETWPVRSVHSKLCCLNERRSLKCPAIYLKIMRFRQLTVFENMRVLVISIISWKLAE